MHCSKCGTELPDDASYCLKCGKPQKDGLTAYEPTWEQCQIRCGRKRANLFSPWEITFEGDAIGPRGRYCAGRSPLVECGIPPDEVSFVGTNYQRLRVALDALVNDLVKEGWEPLETRGEAWWQLRLKRRVRE